MSRARGQQAAAQRASNQEWARGSTGARPGVPQSGRCSSAGGGVLAHLQDDALPSQRGGGPVARALQAQQRGGLVYLCREGEPGSSRARRQITRVGAKQCACQCGAEATVQQTSSLGAGPKWQPTRCGVMVWVQQDDRLGMGSRHGLQILKKRQHSTACRSGVRRAWTAGRKPRATTRNLVSGTLPAGHNAHLSSSVTPHSSTHLGAVRRTPPRDVVQPAAVELARHVGVQLVLVPVRQHHDVPAGKAGPSQGAGSQSCCEGLGQHAQHEAPACQRPCPFQCALVAQHMLHMEGPPRVQALQRCNPPAYLPSRLLSPCPLVAIWRSKRGAWRFQLHTSRWSVVARGMLPRRTALSCGWV